MTDNKHSGDCETLRKAAEWMAEALRGAKAALRSGAGAYERMNADHAATAALAAYEATK